VCTSSGKIRLWNLATEAVVDEVVAHEGACFLTVAESGVRSIANDGHSALWRVNADRLERLSLIALAPKTIAVETGPLANAVTFDGAWVFQGEDGAELARLRLRSKGISRAIATQKAIWLVDSLARLAVVRPVERANPEETRTLSQTRGTLELRAGRLSARGARP